MCSRRSSSAWASKAKCRGGSSAAHGPSGWLLGRDELGLRVQGDTSLLLHPHLRRLRVRSNTWPVGVSTTQNPHLKHRTLQRRANPAKYRPASLRTPDPSKVVTKELSDPPHDPSSRTVFVRDDAIRRPPFHPLPVTETLRGPLRPPSPTTAAAATPSPCHRR